MSLRDMFGSMFLKPRPPSSPNKPPPLPPRSHPKGTPIPVNANFLITGRAFTGSFDDISNIHRRPHTAAVDKNIIKTLKRSPSVDNSFYDRFERLDRDWIEGDKAFKEKGGRVKNDKKDAAPRLLPVPPKPKTMSAKQHKTIPPIPERFLDIAINYDEHFADNSSKPLKKKRVKSANKQEGRNKNRKRPPTNNHESRERSISRKRSERSESKSLASVGSASRCSSRSGNNKPRRQRGRKSRSRTRRDTPRYNDFGSTSRQSPERSSSLVRTLSDERPLSTNPVRANTERKRSETKLVDDIKRVISAHAPKLPPERQLSYVGPVSGRRVLSANVVKLRVDLKQLQDDGHSCGNTGQKRTPKENATGRHRDTKSSPASVNRRSLQELPVPQEIKSTDDSIITQPKRRLLPTVPRLNVLPGATAVPSCLISLSLKRNFAHTDVGKKRNV